MNEVVYFSSKSGNTDRFIRKLCLHSLRIPIMPEDTMLVVSAPFVLVLPTYADGEGRGAVPKQVIRFLNVETNRRYVRGVVGTGNRNFGKFFGYAADIVASRCNVPLLHKLELLGTEEDVLAVTNKVKEL